VRAVILASGILISFSGLVLAAPDLDSGHRYLEVYLKISEAEHLEKKSDLASALKDFKECYGGLLAIHTDNPDWETALVEHRLEDCRAKVLDLQDKITTGLNSPHPNGDTLAKNRAAFPDPIKESVTTYPWKSNVIAGLFWIGKEGVTRSAWDDNWVKTNGGVDSPDDRNGYSTAGHASKLNPFYVALPFNDIAHPEMAQKWLPTRRHREPENGKPVSTCKDRWVWIKNADGQSCFAQWEDAGPFGDDDAGYVFGKGAPKANGKPALSVSPAVRDYLQLNGSDEKPALVSWRFVDDADVPPGAWLKYDEQALIYVEMNK